MREKELGKKMKIKRKKERRGRMKKRGWRKET